MGTHPKLPVRLPSGRLLSEYLAAHPEELGDNVLSLFPQSKDGALPFLFKVLSIGKALSIQAHPDKKLGAQLHARAPDVYTGESPYPASSQHGLMVLQTAVTSPRWPSLSHLSRHSSTFSLYQLSSHTSSLCRSYQCSFPKRLSKPSNTLSNLPVGLHRLIHHRPEIRGRLSELSSNG